MNCWNEPIQFLARAPEYVERLAAVYLALSEEVRGEFYVPFALLEQAQSLGVRNAVGLRGSVNQPCEVKPPVSMNPMVTTGYHDLLVAMRNHVKRPLIYLQVNNYRGSAHARVDVFLCLTEERADWLRKMGIKKSIFVTRTAQIAAEALTDEVQKRGTLKKVTELNGESIGIVYMAFGEKAAQAVKASANSLRRVGLQIPVCVVGSTPVDGFQFIEWKGESPFDAHEKKNFQFRAGRIKPKLYALSPFERTLYIDADTEFMGDILPGFEALDEHDVAIARENLTLGQLYNKALAGWEINLKERDATVKELNAAPSDYFLNSGVVFFRKSAATEAMMRRWHEAWLEWRQWDEQLAFMRACHRTPELSLKVLTPEWNDPRRKMGQVIFHNYGRGVVRMNIESSGQHSAVSGQRGLDTPMSTSATRPAEVLA